MKKTGFTLAEVLITLGIIGVVAALTMPTFTARTQTAKIGPALAKASTAFAESTKAMMAHYEADTLSGMYFCNDGNLSCTDANKILAFNASTTATGEMFWRQFANFMSGSEVPDTNLADANTIQVVGTGVYGFQSADGTTYFIKHIDDSFSAGSPNKSIYGSEVLVDINGAKEPNKESRDQFIFFLTDSGTLIPKGASNPVVAALQSNKTWRDYCPKDSTPTDSTFCAGHVFENGLKVEYK